MLPANSVPTDRASTQPASAPESGIPAACFERLIHLLLPARLDVQECMHPDGIALRPSPVTRGFSWQAPIYEAPRSLKDTTCMHDADGHNRPASTSTQSSGIFRWRRHPALRKAPQEPSLLDDVRQARLAAMKGVLAARDGDLDAAAVWFTEAAREPTIRFQVVPGFWGCTRGAMDAAVVAYEAAGRFRDAAALAATIRTRFRPRIVQSARPADTPMEIGRRTWREEPSAGTGD